MPTPFGIGRVGRLHALRAMTRLGRRDCAKSQHNWKITTGTANLTGDLGLCSIAASLKRLAVWWLVFPTKTPVGVLRLVAADC
jgi:hypothetical protein